MRGEAANRRTRIRWVPECESLLVAVIGQHNRLNRRTVFEIRYYILVNCVPLCADIDDLIRSIWNPERDITFVILGGLRLVDRLSIDCNRCLR